MKSKTVWSIILVLTLCLSLTAASLAVADPAPDYDYGYTADEGGYKAYLRDWVAACPAIRANIDEFNACIDAGAYTDFPLEMCLTDQWFGYAALTFDRFIAAGGNAGIPDFGQVPPSVTPTSATSHSAVEDAFINYIHEWLLGELEINARMTIEQVEDEFMPLVKEMNFTDFPAEMIYNGMFEQGVPMTFEEFAAQYTPADPTPVPTQTPAPEPTPVPPAPTPGPALVPGDFDGDGVLTALDATLILQYLAGS